jgi:hypothetical protein
MNPLIQCKPIILPLFIAGVLACFGLLPKALAVVPPPDGGYPGFNTAEGQNALFSLTTGAGNTAVGWFSLFTNTDGSFNTAVGAGTLLLNIGTVDPAFPGGNENTAVGGAALLSNTTGSGNTAVGVDALLTNDYGFANVAVGDGALQSNFGGSANTAIGGGALFHNLGEDVFFSGYSNTAVGDDALFNNQSGRDNTAIGASAGFSITGSGNVCIGRGVQGQSMENHITRIRNIGNTAQGSGIFATVDAVVSDGGSVKLGYQVSSRRYKEEVKPMNKASESLYALKPVTYCYKWDADPAHVRQYGLIAEDVAEVNPDLVVNDEEGKPATLRFLSIQAMLLNEFLKEHKKVEEQQAMITQLKKDFGATVAQLTARLDEQTTQIQRVSAQLAAASPSRGGLEASRPAPQVVLNNQ